MIELDLSFVASILAIGAFCFGIWRFFLSHAEKYDESHAKNREEHEMIIATLSAQATELKRLTKSIKGLIKRRDKE